MNLRPGYCLVNMPTFSRKSEERLNTCARPLILLFNEVVRYIDCTIIEGHRPLERQQMLLEQGMTTLQKGKHNEFPSMAVDVVPYPVDWEDLDRFRYFAGWVLGIASQRKVDLRWGGDWNRNHNMSDQTFIDLPHYELLEEW